MEDKAFCLITVNTNNKEIFVPLKEKIVDSEKSLLRLIKPLHKYLFPENTDLRGMF